MSPFESISASQKPIIVGIGVFDGVHRGHQAVIHTAIQTAKETGGEAWALTFEPHPLSIIRPDQAPELLTTIDHKQSLLQALGLKGCVIIPFTKALASETPADFIRTLTHHVPRLRGVVVGENFRFGHQAKGDIELLRQLGSEHGFNTIAVPPVLHLGESISSTRIRSALRDDHLADASNMLGRPFTIRGKVTRGKRIGRTLGFPTANLDIQGVIRPPSGVYAVTAKVGSALHGGAAYIGRRPSYQSDGGTAMVEVHLFDWDQELYGSTLELHLLEKLRGDLRFSSDAELKQQIGKDVESARTALARNRGVATPR